MIKIKFQNKKRRGLSSIVGALIFVVLMVATFTVLGVALNSQANIVETNVEVAETGLKKTQEKFSISVFTDPSEILTVNVDNQGQNPVEIHSLVITNQTGPAAILADFPTTIHNIASETSFVASDDIKDIVSTTPLKLNLAALGETEIYHFKVISSLGTIKTVQLTCGDTVCGAVSSGGGELSATLFLDGPNGINTKISTIIMIVSNTYDVDLTNVRPTAGWEGGGLCVANGFFDLTFESVTETIVSPETFEPCTINHPITGIPLLPAHSSAVFKWDGVVNGDVDSIFTFTSGVEGIHPVTGPIPPSSITFDSLTIINPNDCGGCGEGGDDGAIIILIDDLLIRPSLFLIIPSPFGIPNQPPAAQLQYSGLWGVNVVNPTSTPMNITKLTIAAYPPGSTPGAIPFKEGISDCEIEDISPGDAINELSGAANSGRYSGYWDCPLINVILWENHANPITIDSRSNQEFLARVIPGSIAGGDNLDAVIVQANVFTSSGSFGKVGYQTTMYDATTGPIANVYITDTNDSRSDTYSERLGIFSNSTETFKVVFADLDNDDATSIASDARLIVNVPREWKDVVVTNSTGFSGTPSVVEHGDSSTQIIAITGSPIGGFGDPDAKTITFTTEAPDVIEEGVKRLYIMYILADGVTEAVTPRSVGPLNEAVLQVLPSLS